MNFAQSEELELTVITPVFNGEKWIEETINSVLLNCENSQYEYIVVNDGSTDSSLEIINKFSKQVRIINQSNQGEAASVNNALSAALGKYILVVSADDPMRSKELLLLGLDILNSQQNIVCVYPDWSVINEKSEIVRDVQVPEFSNQSLIGDYQCIVGPGGIFRREAAVAIGGRNPEYKFTSDYDFWLRLSTKGDFKRIPFKLAFWRGHEASTSIAQRGLDMGYERILVMRNFLDSHQNYPNKLKRQALGNAFFHAALLIYFDEQIPGRKWLMKSFLSYPLGIFRYNVRIVGYILLYPVSKTILTKFKLQKFVKKNA